MSTHDSPLLNVLGFVRLSSDNKQVTSAPLEAMFLSKIIGLRAPYRPKTVSRYAKRAERITTKAAVIVTNRRE